LTSKNIVARTYFILPHAFFLPAKWHLCRSYIRIHIHSQTHYLHKTDWMWNSSCPPQSKPRSCLPRSSAGPQKNGILNGKQPTKCLHKNLISYARESKMSKE